MDLTGPRSWIVPILTTRTAVQDFQRTVYALLQNPGIAGAAPEDCAEARDEKEQNATEDHEQERSACVAALLAPIGERWGELIGNRDGSRGWGRSWSSGNYDGNVHRREPDYQDRWQGLLLIPEPARGKL